jgi:hypothetical protein
MKAAILMLLLLAAVMLMMSLQPRPAQAVECALGEATSLSIGDGVILHSCSWEQTPGVFLRTGPMEMVRHGVLILRLHTDRNGKLQGQFSSWDDAGVLTENGHYVDGLKHGEWLVTDANGERRVEHYRAGVLIAP